MASHLYRYGSELALLEDIVHDLQRYYVDFHDCFPVGLDGENVMPPQPGFGQITSQLASMRRFREELQLKTSNVLALVCIRYSFMELLLMTAKLVDITQVTNDRLLVQTSKAMHLILQATEAETKLSRRIARQSHRLAEEMKKDSVAMKTVSYALPSSRCFCGSVNHRRLPC